MKWARETAFFTLFLALAVALTWPFAARINTAVPDLGDPLLNAWILDWVAHALTHRPLDLFSAPIFHPAILPLAFSENLIGIAILMLPFHLAGLPALTVYNLAMLLGFAHAGYGAFVLARVVTGRTLPAIVGGIFFAFVSYKFDHLSHLQIIWSGWLPLMLAALIVYWRRPALGSAALLFGAFLMNGLTNIHFLLFGGAALMFAVVMLAVFDPRRDRRFWGGLVAALGLAGALLLPVLLPYREVADLYKMKRERGEVASFSATWSDWLHTTTRSRVYARYQPPDIQHERLLFPGLVALFLIGAGAVMGGTRAASPADPHGVSPPAGEVARVPLMIIDTLIVFLGVLVWFGAVTERFTITAGGRLLLAIRGTDIPFMLLVVLIAIRLAIRFPRALGGDGGRSLRTAVASSRFSPEAWAAAMWIAIGVLGSLGLNAFFHTFFYQRVEGFAALRVPARWAVIAYAGMAVWVAIGSSALMKRRAMAFVLPLLMIVETLPSIRWENAPVEVPRVYRWLNETRIGPVLELPPEDQWSGQFLYLLYATSHRVPLMNGTSGFEPPVHLAIRDAYLNDKMHAGFTALLEQNGAKILIVHSDALSHHRNRTLAWIKGALRSQRLAFLRRFDNGVSGDWVFAVTRNLPDWTTYRDFEPEAAGQLASFLSGEPTFNNSTFGRLDMPDPYQTVQGPLKISGWGLSPAGIRSATAFLYSDRIRVPLENFERPDVHSEFPWYPKNARPGFIAVLPKRPKGFPRETNVQIELVDNEGRAIRLRDVPFTWN